MKKRVILYVFLFIVCIALFSFIGIPLLRRDFFYILHYWGIGK